jgi:tetratricopeptide (TPR) repeat protein
MIVLFVLWNLAQWLRDTNSHAAAAKGQAAYQHQKYDAAASAYGKANAIAPTPQNAFNLGTAQIASGKREEGASTLQKAMNDPSLRADALYNRGNSALEAKAYDYAIRDYAAALRLRPSDPRAKRNLEIALAHKAMQQKQPSSNGKQQGGSGGQQQKQQPRQPTPAAQQKNDNAEALLRAVQQQETEEQQRMRRAGRERVRVGW